MRAITRLGVAAAFLLATLPIGALAAPSGAPVVLPSVVGQPEDAAIRELGAAGMTTRRQAATVVEKSSIGKVLQQAPPAGKSVPRGTEVTLTIGRAADRVVVPSVQNMPFGSAQAALTMVNLQVQRVEPGVPTPDAALADKVARQSPAGGQIVAPGSPVRLEVYVREKPAEMTVPSLVGKTEAEARDALSALGLIRGSNPGGPLPSTPDSRLVGRVGQQAPAPGTKVAKGTVVHLSLFVPAPDVAVPSVVGQEQSAAVRQLQSVGMPTRLQDEVVTDKAEVGRVRHQGPSAGTNVRPGSEVTLWVGKAPDRITVPSVLSMPLAEAQASLSKAGLDGQRGEPSVPTSDPRLVGKVAQQSPAVGQAVAPGSRVLLRTYVRGAN